MRQDSIISRGSLKLTNSNFPIFFHRKLLNLKILGKKLKIYQDRPQKYDMTEKKIKQLCHKSLTVQIRKIYPPKPDLRHSGELCTFSC